VKGIAVALVAAAVVFHVVTGMPWLFCLLVVPAACVALNVALDILGV